MEGHFINDNARMTGRGFAYTRRSFHTSSESNLATYFCEMYKQNKIQTDNNQLREMNALSRFSAIFVTGDNFCPSENRSL